VRYRFLQAIVSSLLLGVCAVSLTGCLGASDCASPCGSAASSCASACDTSSACGSGSSGEGLSSVAGPLLTVAAVGIAAVVAARASHSLPNRDESRTSSEPGSEASTASLSAP
jgi:hypothetical protein